MKQHEQTIEKLYIKEIKDNKYDIIPIEIERALLTSAKEGNKKSEQQLINAHLRLVVNIAKRYKSNNELADLIQEGNLGLYEAYKKFNCDKNVRFCAYAKWWVRKYIVEYLQKKNKVSDNEFKELDKEDDDKPNIGDTYSEDAKFDYENSLMQEEAREEQKQSNASAILELLDSLDERLRYIIESVYGLNDQTMKTLIEISEEMEISPERVRQLKNRAMMILRSQALINSTSK